MSDAVSRAAREVREYDLEQDELYECAECSAKPGSPLLCQRCLDARSKAGSRWKGTRPRLQQGPPPMLEGLPVPRCPGCRAEGEKSAYYYERTTFVDMTCGVCSHRYRLHRAVVLESEVVLACASRGVDAKIVLANSVLEQIVEMSDGSEPIPVTTFCHTGKAS